MPFCWLMAFGEVFPRAPAGWDFEGTRRIWESHSPAYGLSDAPAAFHLPLRKYFADSANSMAKGGLRSEVSAPDPRPYCVFRQDAGAAGAIAAHAADILGCC